MKDKRDYKTQIKCPVCYKKCLKHALKQHIIGTARTEIYKNYLWGNNTLIKEPSMKHQGYIEDHSTKINKLEIIL